MFTNDRYPQKYRKRKFIYSSNVRKLNEKYRVIYRTVKIYRRQNKVFLNRKKEMRRGQMLGSIVRTITKDRNSSLREENPFRDCNPLSALRQWSTRRN